MNDIEMLNQLQLPQGKIDAVLDTDTYNEIDDQYAVAYMLAHDEKINVQAFYAAPFDNDKSSGPSDGVDKSYTELTKILTLCKREDMISKCFKGSREFLKDEKTPVYSDAALDLVKRASNYSKENPLYVIAIAAITNVASAILIDPSIVDKIVIVWLGGNALHWEDNKEFNLMQDVASARVVFGYNVPLVQVPCAGVVSAFSVSEPELKEWMIGKNPLCDYLAKNTIEYESKYHSIQPFTWVKPIWDVTAVAYLLNENQKFMKEKIIHAPIPEYDHKYAFSDKTKFIKYVYHINRNELFYDLFTTLATKFN